MLVIVFKAHVLLIHLIQNQQKNVIFLYALLMSQYYFCCHGKWDVFVVYKNVVHVKLR